MSEVQPQQRVRRQAPGLPVSFGFAEEQTSFAERHQEFFLRSQNLLKLMHEAYQQKFEMAGPEAIIPYTMGRLCCEDFYEILLLAANGYGIGALRLLRGMYERAVTVVYLCEHPDEIEAFTDYYHVQQHKLMVAIVETFGTDILKGKRTDVEEAEREYARVKEKYMVTACKECGAERVNHTWHKLDVVSMAKKTPLGKLIVPAYYIPMSHTHPTMRSLLSRMEDSDEGMGFNPDAQPKDADFAFHLAHNITLAVVETHIEYFKLKDSLNPLFQTCLQDFKDIWNKKIQERDEAAKGM